MRISDWSSDVCSSDLLFLWVSSCRQLTGGTERRSARNRSAGRRPIDVVAPEVEAQRLRAVADHRLRRPLVARVEQRQRAPCDRVRARPAVAGVAGVRSEEHTSELQSLMRNSYAVFCLKKKK